MRGKSLPYLQSNTGSLDICYIRDWYYIFKSLLPDERVYLLFLKLFFSYFSTKTYVVATQKNPHHLRQIFKRMDKKLFKSLHFRFVG